MVDIHSLPSTTNTIVVDRDDVTPAQIDALKQDIVLARAAIAELGNPFHIAMAGWKIGSVDNPAEFDDPELLPYEAPIMGLWDEAESFEHLSPH